MEQGEQRLSYVLERDDLVVLIRWLLLDHTVVDLWLATPDELLLLNVRWCSSAIHEAMVAIWMLFLIVCHLIVMMLLSALRACAVALSNVEGRVMMLLLCALEDALGSFGKA